jgi:thymidylate synthase (FAD)
VAETKRPTSPTAEEILGLYFPVLDHGFVSLVDYMGTDEDIERAGARQLRLRHAQAERDRGPAALSAAGTSTRRPARWSS